MPVITVELWKGRTTEQKRTLVKSITSATVAATGAPPEAVHIVIHEVEKENWGIAGELASEKYANK